MGQGKINFVIACLTLERQDRQCMHNVRLWYIHITIVAVEMQQCILCFSPYLINGTILRKKSIDNKTVILILSIKSAYNISLSKKNSERYYHKCTQVFKQSTPSNCHTNKLEFCQDIFIQSSSTKFHENPSSRSQMVLCRQT